MLAKLSVFGLFYFLVGQRKVNKTIVLVSYSVSKSKKRLFYSPEIMVSVWGLVYIDITHEVIYLF